MDWVSLAIGVLGSTLAAIIVSALAWSRGIIFFSWSALKSSYLLQKRLKQAGFSNFYASRLDYAKYRGAPRLVDYLSMAKHRIDVAGYWMAHGNEAEGIANEIAHFVQSARSMEVTISIINPKSSYIDALAGYLNLTSEELLIRIRSTLFNLNQARNRLSEDEKKRFILKVYNTIPIASVIILDGDTSDSRIQLDFKPYKTPRFYSFSIELIGPGKELYDLCYRAWSQLIEDAEIFDPAKHLN